MASMIDAMLGRFGHEGAVQNQDDGPERVSIDAELDRRASPTACVSRRHFLSAATSGLVGAAVVSACGKRPEKGPGNLKPTARAPKLPSSDTQELRQKVQQSRASGSTVRLDPSHTYLVNDAIDVTGAKIDGRGATIKWAGTHASGGALGLLYSSVRANIWNLTIALDRAESRAGPLAGIASSFAGAGQPRIDVRGVTVRNGGGAGISVSTAQGWQSGDGTRVVARMSSVHIADCRYGIQVTGIVGVLVEDTVVANCTANGIHAKLCSGVSLKGNRVTSCEGHGVAVLYSPGCRIERNNSSHNGLGGITIGGGDPTLEATRDVTVVGNTANRNGLSGISLDVTQYGRPGIPIPVDANLRSNTCTGNKKAGINITCSSDVTLERNTCTENYNGIALSTKDTTVQGNRCTDNEGWGVAMFDRSTTKQYGDHMIGPNVVSGNGRGAYFVAPGLSGRVHFSKRVK